MEERLDYIKSRMADGFTEIDCIEGLKGMYGIDRNGDIFSVRKMGLLKRCHHSLGYQQVYLTYFYGGGRWFKLHRLVALQFIPNPLGLTDINHLNGIKTDNRVENLQWCSHSDNVKHSYRVLGRVHDSSYLGKMIRCITTGKVYQSAVLAAKDLGVSTPNITACVKGRIKSTKGYSFEYYSPETIK